MRKNPFILLTLVFCVQMAFSSFVFAQKNPAGGAGKTSPQGNPPSFVPARPVTPSSGAASTLHGVNPAKPVAGEEDCDKEHGTHNLNLTFKPDAEYKIPPAEAVKKFVEFYNRFDALSEKHEALSEKIEEATPEQEKLLAPQMRVLSKEIHDLYHVLQELVEPAWIGNPDQEEVVEFLLFLMASALDEDQYEVAYELAREMMSKSVHKDQPILYEMAGVAAFMINRWDVAELCFREAKANDEITDRGVDLQAMLPYYKHIWKQESAQREKDAAANLPRVVLQTTKGNVVLELFEDQAPNSVANFIFLVEKRFYDNNDFHTVIDGFMAQSGSPQPDGTGHPGYAIQDECGKADARKHFRGSLSMAHLGANTSGSQFFVTLVPTSHLDGKFTVFGRVLQGIEVISALEKIDVSDESGETDSGMNEPDKIIKAQVLRKRNHVYEPQRMAIPK